MHTDRRTLVRGAAWSVPVFAVAAAAPAFAASYPPIKITYVETAKCPGNSSGGVGNEFTYVFKFTADSPPAPGSVSATLIVINGVEFPVERVVVEGSDIYVITEESTNSAAASGSGSITYTSGSPAVTQTSTFDYVGSDPDHQLCSRI